MKNLWLPGLLTQFSLFHISIQNNLLQTISLLVDIVWRLLMCHFNPYNMLSANMWKSNMTRGTLLLICGVWSHMIRKLKATLKGGVLLLEMCLYVTWSSRISQKSVVTCYWFQKFYFVSYANANVKTRHLSQVLEWWYKYT